MKSEKHISSNSLESPHGPSCTCGCHDHGAAHEQSRGYEHEHGHEHGHERTALEFSGCTVSFESYAHEQASVTSGTIAGRKPGFSAGQLCSFLKACAVSTKAEGGLVGHFKAFAKVGEDTMKASITTALSEPLVSGNRNLACAEGSAADFALIAVGVKPSRMGEIVARALCETFGEEAGQ